MPIRVLHAPTDTGRQAWTLAQAEKRLGLESTVLVYHSTWLNYPNDIDLKMRERSAVGKLTAVGRLLVRIARDYDIVHFNGGRSLMPSSPNRAPWISRLDLQYLKAIGKGVVVTFQGCDVRQYGPCKDRFDVNACVCCSTPCSPELDRHKAYIAQGFGKYADALFSLNPDLMWELPERAEFLPYATIDLEEWHLEPMDAEKPTFTILHAPTNRGVKGTDRIVEAVHAMQQRHPEVELVLVENTPHDQVRDLYRRADLVIDQVLLGWYGGFAVEAMALGRPVLAYIREDDLHFVPEGMRSDMPIIKASPDDLDDVLEQVFRDRHGLPELGRRSRRYVERWHDPLTIAAGVKSVYERILGVSRDG